VRQKGKAAIKTERDSVILDQCWERRMPQNWRYFAVRPLCFRAAATGLGRHSRAPTLLPTRNYTLTLLKEDWRWTFIRFSVNGTTPMELWRKETREIV
jgi:hypothetical protein